MKRGLLPSFPVKSTLYISSPTYCLAIASTANFTLF